MRGGGDSIEGKDESQMDDNSRLTIDEIGPAQVPVLRDGDEQRPLLADLTRSPRRIAPSGSRTDSRVSFVKASVIACLVEVDE